MRGIAIRPQRTLRVQGPICQFCQFSTRPELSASPKLQGEPLRKTQQHAVYQPRNPDFRRSYAKKLTPNSPNTATNRLNSLAQTANSSSGADRVVDDIREKFQSIVQADKAAPEEEVVALLQQCLQTVESYANPAEQREKGTSNATSSLLDLADTAEAHAARPDKGQRRRATDTISDMVDELLLNDKVFISTETLELYTKIQSLLKRGNHFPRIFSLFANKPIPQPGTSPIKFSEPNPADVKNAVPSELATMALDVALSQKNLPLALAIIDTTFCAPAFYRAKMFKKAGVPLGGLVAAPLASYVVATWAASLQNTMDPSMATGIAFTATLAYIGFTSSVGVIAITTANDQMERVVWSSGIPLRHRWLREEERAALDKVAVAWGFKDVLRRGEEEGEEWENLREFIGMRGMILDKTELMEGMQ
ncbi:uncharacterized protein TRUGW13939_02997 [Talaromyces rugulosus]|uniref:Uncharacterized protein n=1 Tax=Talaromyces rugulosus TaxID=121627 RepID=A0A7H8QPU3_TALRU|nr:uncharacterized protein TRUGW13939_02997 [Talaromyces rugulosus]QKX55898.1 hypothetical protein TRUGW13939_02997 [Talaromyces rugulosus]